MANKLAFLKNRVLLIVYFFIQTILVHGQQSKIVGTGRGARMEKISNDVYAIIHEDATDEWPHSNTGVIIGKDAVMVIDACYLPSMAMEDIKLIRSVTNKPVKYMAYTHWHFDHTNGSIVYRDSFPNIRFISEKNSAKFIELNAVWWAKRSIADSSSKRQSLATLISRLNNPTDSSTNVLTDQEILRLREVISKRQGELAELATLKVIKPDYLFEDSLSIDLGNRKVYLIDRGKANSPHDVTIYIPNEKILFTGDILVQSPLPYCGACWPVPWVEVLKDLEKIPVNAMVPGHGPVLYDHSYTRMVREFLESLIKKVEALIWQGKTIEQVQATINMDEFRKGPWHESNKAANDDWIINLQTIIERVWRGIRGQG